MLIYFDFLENECKRGHTDLLGFTILNDLSAQQTTASRIVQYARHEYTQKHIQLIALDHSEMV